MQLATSFGKRMKMRFTKKIAVFFVAATSALYLTACGTRAGQDATEAKPVQIENSTDLVWEKVSGPLYRACDKKTGVLIYQNWDNIAVVKDGCEKAGAQ
jgi:hypothetical protein